MLYSKNNNYPEPLPNRIRLSNGMTRTGQHTFTEEEIRDAGYVLVDSPPSLSDHEELHWEMGESGIFGWVVKKRSIHEQWDIVKKERREKMYDMEWRMNRHIRESMLRIERKDKDPQFLTKGHEYMQALADITKQTDPYNIKWPEEILPTVIPVPLDPNVPSPVPLETQLPNQE